MRVKINNHDGCKIVEPIGVMNSQAAYVHFRRAWSYKNQGKYAQAGEDFETAKKLTKDSDPNFAVDYKKIAKCSYMVIQTEPDFMEKFPLLVPIPGFAMPA
jgi:hypothetical protein